MKVKVKNKEDELKNQLARALADYDNLVKRIERERHDLEKLSSLKIILKLLPVLDNLRVVLAHLKDPGLAIALKDFEEVLKSEDIEEIEAKQGGKFDHNLHEATEVTQGKKGEITGVVLPGFRFTNGPVIRHAKVKVGGKS
jgi:molecular chaperone GrpE